MLSSRPENRSRSLAEPSQQEGPVRIRTRAGTTIITAGAGIRIGIGTQTTTVATGDVGTTDIAEIGTTEITQHILVRSASKTTIIRTKPR